MQIVDLWRSANEFGLIECYRGAGKTTKGEEHLRWKGCFGNFNFCLIIAETYEKACERIDAIDKECRTNMKLLPRLWRSGSGTQVE